jgi:MOSC domain-containing protein YiiM
VELRITSVNVTPVVGGTAIAKQPVEGPVAVTPLGLDGDGVGSPKHHGGPDQALYAYGVPDYAWWTAQLGRFLPPGMFGENLTIDRLRSADVAVGDRFVCEGGVVMEATAPRIACNTLARRMGAGDFAKRFALAERPGVYLRVVQAGNVMSGETVTFEPSTDRTVMLLDVQHAYYDTLTPAGELRRILAAPIDERSRAHLEARLARRG